jgi:hypothetical protein
VICQRCGHDKKLRARGMCNACYSKVQRRDQYTGCWRSLFVDAGPVIAHIARLEAVGVTKRQVTRLTGYKPVYELRPDRPIHQRAHDAILAIPVPTRDVAADMVLDCATIESSGTLRRLQALSMMGWAMPDLARHHGRISGVTLNGLLREERPMVQARTARAVAVLYDELAMLHGPSPAARQRAIEHGWWPPLAWDDDKIDEPATIPTGVGPQRKLSFMDTYSELRALGYYDDETIAAKMGIEVKSLQRQLTPSRHGKVSA